MNAAAALTWMSLLAASPTPDGKTPARHSRSNSPAAEPLSFKEFFVASPRELKPSEKLLSLNGKRVHMVGYMARMERPIHGAFYLVPHPVTCDEEGGGTSDLPVENVLVLVRSAKGREIAFIPRPLEVTGILEVGNREESDGRVSAIRLTLDGLPAPGKAAKTMPKTAITKRGEK
jgi:hypothetical protein